MSRTWIVRPCGLSPGSQEPRARSVRSLPALVDVRSAFEATSGLPGVLDDDHRERFVGRHDADPAAPPRRLEQRCSALRTLCPLPRPRPRPVGGDLEFQRKAPASARPRGDGQGPLYQWRRCSSPRRGRQPRPSRLKSRPARCGAECAQAFVDPLVAPVDLADVSDGRGPVCGEGRDDHRHSGPMSGLSRQAAFEKPRRARDHDAMRVAEDDPAPIETSLSTKK